MKNNNINKKLYQSILVFLLALVSITATSYAWFSLSKNTRVHSMSLEITTGYKLRIDTEAHSSIDDYYRDLQGTHIVNLSKNTQLAPVTSNDGVSFFTEDGIGTNDTIGTYLEVPLHFRSLDAMNIHLSTKPLRTTANPTLVSGTNGIEKAIRISFTTNDSTKIYEPYGVSANTFSLENSDEMVYNKSNALFYIEKDVDLPVTMRIWLEGNDPDCTDVLRNALYDIQLCFVGTDENYIPLDS